MIQANILEKQVKVDEKNKHHLSFVKKRLVLARDRARTQEEENRLLEEKYHKLKEDIQCINRNLHEVTEKLNDPCYASLDAIEDHFASLSLHSEAAKKLLREYLDKTEQNPEFIESDGKNSSEILLIQAEDSIKRAMSEANRLRKVHDLS